ncbi:MAG: YaaR family protein [Selenomonas artemidis]|nr:YaaR family protein [Selenomonas artemidis]
MAMKIDSSISQSTSMTMPRAANDTGVRGASTDFSMELADQESSMSREAMDRLLEKIDEQGARLSKSPTYEELRSYRALIQSFIGEAVDGMYELHTQAGWDRLGRQKVYTSVRKIDKKLEEMAEKIRLGQADQLSIIASHDAIRGLLVDLYM